MARPLLLRVVAGNKTYPVESFLSDTTISDFFDFARGLNQNFTGGVVRLQVQEDDQILIRLSDPSPLAEGLYILTISEDAVQRARMLALELEIVQARLTLALLQVQNQNYRNSRIAAANAIARLDAQHVATSLTFSLPRSGSADGTE